FLGRKMVKDPEARFWDIPEEEVETVGVDDDLPQTMIDNYFPDARVETLPKIPAYVHADNYLFDATFEANRWFEQASDEQIVELAKSEWTGSMADEAARFVEVCNDSVKLVFVYADHRTERAATTEVNAAIAMDWIREHRPHLA